MADQNIDTAHGTADLTADLAGNHPAPKAALATALTFGLAAGAVLIGVDWLASGSSADASSTFLTPPWKPVVLLALPTLLLYVLLTSHQRRSHRRESLLRRTEVALLASEARARAVLENAADGIIAADGAGTINLFNPAAARIFQYAPEEILGRNIKTLIPRPYLREHESYRLKAGPIPEPESEIHRMGREVVGRRNSGESFPVELAVSEVFEEPHRLFIAVVRDITLRKRAEDELTQSREQLRSLAARLQTIREAERTRISREIHDELGQSLTGVKMDLSWIASRLPKEPALQERAKSMFELIDGTIQTVRKIATELRPGVLDNLGLVAALEWQSGEFQSRTGITCECEADPDFPEPDAARGTVLFRICQETLTNVARHAQASRVRIRLEQSPDGIRLRIADNGRGIAPEEMTGTRSLGLLGMRERAAMVGGRVDIAREAHSGTSVTITLPPAANPTPVLDTCSMSHD